MQQHAIFSNNPNMPLVDIIQDGIQQIVRDAMEKYHDLYDNEAYSRAISGKSSEYANALTDEALALCGHPHYKLSNRWWGRDALEYLRLFT